MADRLVLRIKLVVEFLMSQSSIDPRLLEVLVCPLSKVPLRYDREKQELISDQAKLAYPIRDGVPIMLVEEARNLDK